MRSSCKKHGYLDVHIARLEHCPFCLLDQAMLDYGSLTDELAEARETIARLDKAAFDTTWSNTAHALFQQAKEESIRAGQAERAKYEAIRMAQAAVTCSKDWQKRAEECEEGWIKEQHGHQKLQDDYATLQDIFEATIAVHGPHRTPDDCPTWYDECNCTLETLQAVITERDRYREALEYIATAMLTARHCEDVARDALEGGRG